MFGFGRKAAAEPPARSGRGRTSAEGRDRPKGPKPDLSFLGIGGDDFGDMDVGDDDLENELLALMNEGSKGGGRRAKPNPGINPILAKPLPSASEISKLGESDAEDDEDISESELEAELSEITQEEAPPVPERPAPPPRAAAAAPAPVVSLVPLLQERLKMYEAAKAAADAAGDTSKSRRFTRALKTLQDLLKSAKAGKAVDENDIPPVVAVTIAKKPEAPRPDPVEVSDNVNDDTTAQQEPQPPRVEPGFVPVAEPVAPAPEKIEASPEVQQHLMTLKKVAVVLKRNGDVAGGLKYLKLSKALEAEIQSGNQIDLTLFPLPPEPEQSPPQPTAPEPAPPTEIVQADPPSEPVPVADAPETPKTIMEALLQRLDKYKSEVEKANSSNNSSKARRMGRIVKQYEEAIAFHKKGKPVAYEELPTPPGYAPIPVPQSAAAPGPSSSGNLPAGPSAEVPGPAPVVPIPKLSPQDPSAAAGPSAVPGKSTSPAQAVVRNPQKPGAKLTLQEKQLHTILQKQQQYKDAALNAKKRGDLSQARELLRTAKGFDALIQASKCGLPVDMATLPSDPEIVAAMEAEDYEVVGGDDCIVPEGDIAEVYSKLEEDLKNQLKTCMRNREHFKNIGDIASANRFEKMALESKRDLDTLRLAAKQKSSLPTYRYETRIFSITECNTDLQEDEMEIEIVRGINFKVANPNEIDTFVKLELPYPTAEEPQRQKTDVIYNTNNPVFNAKFKFSINRKERKFQRLVHAKGVKLELWSKGGFLRSNTQIGSGTIKLLGLETKCTIHEGVDILEGRKNVGKLEVKTRLRDPVLSKQITQTKEKWLSIEKA